MTRTMMFLFLIFTLVACGKSGGGSGSSVGSGYQGDVVDLEEVTSSEVVPSAALNFDVDLKLHKFNAEQEDKVLEAAELIKKVIASEEFKRRVLNHKIKGKKAFNDNKGLSNAQIYKRILEGSEKLRPGKDNTMNLDLEVYRENNNTVGYTYPSVIKVWMNSKYLNKNSPAKVTTNMMHEWLHKLGFKHDVKPTPDRKYSVPYAIGYLVAKIAAKMD